VDGELTRSGILEALLFVAEDPLPLARLQEALGDEERATTDAALRELALSLERDGRGLMIQEVAGGFRLTTRPEAHPWIQRLQQVKPARLSRPALETLAIVAYRQPITRAEIEQVRGVAVDGVIRTLLERDLIRILGRKTEAGRPIVYGTSTAFLEHFGFKELGDLPTLKEIDELVGTSAPERAAAEPAPASVGIEATDSPPVSPPDHQPGDLVAEPAAGGAEAPDDGRGAGAGLELGREPA
jgi:segregation and condensation protein B